MTSGEPREPLFERAGEYETLLAQGTRLSGEDRHFFVRGRLADLVAHLPGGFAPRRILDFGCGLGDTSRALAEAFPGADVVGVDDAAAALAWAREHHGGPHVRFAELERMAEGGPFDLCYLNGVMHHVPPARRARVVGDLHAALGPGGLIALFENNPWNPGARMVMRRIPFDRDAVPLSVRETRRLLEAGGFEPLRTRSLFWFPRALRWLRPLEGALAGVPLGAQYWVLARRRG
jgi:SAM-dependent methyltransferase